MESNGPPSPDEASAALADADAARIALAERVAVPPVFLMALGAAVAVQIATTTAGITGATGRPGLLIASGLVLFVVVALGLLAHLRRSSGLWLAGLVNQVVGGTASAAVTSYTVAFWAALWAAFVGNWWLVAVCAAAGGTAYALSGLAWLRRYRADPAAHASGVPAAWLLAIAAAVAAGLLLLIALA